MNKLEFLDQLRMGLSGLPQNEREERLAFYSEMIEDHMEDGASEEEAVSRIGSVDEIIIKIAEETSFTKIVKEHIKPKRKRQVLEIVLLSLGSPIWGSLLVAVSAIVFSIYVSLWAIIVSLWAVELSIVVGAVGAIVLSPVYAVQGSGTSAAVMVSCGMVLAGLAILFFFAFKAATKGVIWLMKKMIVNTKKAFLRKEKEA